MALGTMGGGTPAMSPEELAALQQRFRQAIPDMSIMSNQATTAPTAGAQGKMTWNDYLTQIATDPGAYQKFTIDANASSNPFLTNSYSSPGPMNYYIGQDPNDQNKLQLIAPTDDGSGNAYTKSFDKKGGIDPWILLPFLGAGAGMVAAGAGLASAAGAGAAGGGAAAGSAGAMSLADAMAAYAPEFGSSLAASGMGAPTFGAGLAGMEGVGGMSLADAMSTYAPNFSSDLAAAGMGDAAGGLSLADAMSTYAPNFGSELAANGMGAPAMNFGGGMDWMSGLTDMFSGGGSNGLLGKAGDFLTSKAGSALLGGLLGGSSSGPDNLTSTSQSKMDPRMDPYVYGPNGILPQIMNQLGKPQSPGMANFGTQMDNYVGNWGEGIMDAGQKTAQALQGSNISAPQVQAPSQNNLNLSPAYQDMIYGAPGANPYLTGAIQKGINQSTNAFGNYITDATKATTDQLGNIRGGAVVNGALGGSRQGIAEGRALSDLSTNLTRAATQFGQGNTDAAVAAQAGAYDTDRNRQLAAMSGLGAQQYGVAQQNAQLQADTNRLNSQNQIAGTGLSSGLLGQAYGMGQNNDQYDLNKIGKVSGLLGNYTGLNGSQTSSQPLYQNTAGNVLGGVTAGLGLWNAFNK